MKDVAEGHEPLLPKGVLAHVCDGRARFSFEGRRGDAEFFETLKGDIGAVAGVSEVIARPATGSVIIAFEGAIEDFFKSLARARLFELAPRPPEPALSDIIRQQAKRFEDDLKGVSNGAVDLPGLAFLAFASVGAVQLVRGKIGISAVTAFWYAADVLLKPKRGGDTNSTDAL